MVVNPFRPFTDTAEKIVEAARALEAACKSKIDGFVYNPNLLEFSSSDLVDEGWATMSAAADMLNIPIRLITIMDEYAEPDWTFSQADIPVLRMERTFFYPSDDRV